MTGYNKNNRQTDNSKPQKIDLGAGLKVTPDEAKDLLYRIMDQYVCLTQRYIKQKESLDKLESDLDKLKNKSLDSNDNTIQVSTNQTPESFKFVTAYSYEPIQLYVFDNVWPDQLPYITEEKACFLGDLTPSSLKNWCEDLGIQVIKQGDNLFYPWHEVETLLPVVPRSPDNEKHQEEEDE